MAQCLALPANRRAAGPRVLHISRCPNVNPQGCPGRWPDAQHSLLTLSGPLRCRQVPVGTEVGRGQKRRRKERAYVKAAGEAVLAWGSEPRGGWKSRVLRAEAGMGTGTLGS